MYADQCDGGVTSLAWLLDWIIDTGCSAHDIHNGSRWSLYFLVVSPNLLKDLHIIIQSLRQSFDLILRFIRPFLDKHLGFRSERSDAQEAHRFWLCLVVGSDVGDLLIELDVLVQGNTIYVHEPHRQSPKLMEQLTSCLLYIFKWEQYTESRWLTITSSPRSLCASMAVGIHLLVGMVMGDDSLSKYYIGGFARMTPEIAHYVTVASIAGWPCEALMAEVLTDDRLLRRSESLANVFFDEVRFVVHVGAPRRHDKTATSGIAP